MKRFFIIFIGLMALLFLAELTPFVREHFIQPFTTALARLCSWLVGLFDGNAASHGVVLTDTRTGKSVAIEAGCNGIEACIVLFAAIMAFPSTWGYRIKGLILGFIAIQALNVVRIISLFYLNQWNEAWFNFFHTYLWAALIMLDVLIVFMVWVRRNPSLKEPPGNGGNAAPPPATATATMPGAAGG